MAPTPTLDELSVADSPRAWRDCGFAVEGEACVVGDVRIRLLGRRVGRGLVGWSLRNLSRTELDGLPTRRSQRPPPAIAAEHPNGVTALDHVVVISPNLDRTVAAFGAAGLELRRVRDEPTPAGAPRQAFYRLGSPILEVVQEPEETTERRGGGGQPAFFWGLAFVAPRLEVAVGLLGAERIGDVHDAVQPGRRIATLRRAAGLGLPVALITPPPER